MGQIVGTTAKVKRCNLGAIQTGGSQYSTVLAAGEYMLVSSNNSMTATGNGIFDAYIVGDGTKTCGALAVHSLMEGGMDLLPQKGSTNGVVSNGLYNLLYIEDNTTVNLSLYTEEYAFPAATGKWVTNYQSLKGKFVPCSSGERYKVTANSSIGTTVCFVQNNSYANGENVPYATGYSGNGVNISAGGEETFVAPSDATFFYVATSNSSGDRTPSSIIKEDEYSLKEYIEDIDEDPVQNSNKLVSSGGVFDLTYIDNYEEVDLSQYTTEYAMPAATGNWVVRYQNWKGKFIPCTGRDAFRIVASSNSDATCCFLKDKNYVANQPVNYATGYSGVGVTISAGTSQVLDAPIDAVYLYIRAQDSSSVNVLPAFAGKNAPYPIKEYLDDADSEPVANSYKLVLSGGVYTAIDTACEEVIDRDYAFISTDEFSKSVVSPYQPEKITIENQDGTITITSISRGGRGFIYFPVNLTNGKEYTLHFHYTCTANETCWWWFSSAPDVTGDNANAFSTSGTSGELTRTFTKDSDINGFYIAASDFVGNTVVVSQIAITFSSSISERLDDTADEVEKLQGDLDNSLTRIQAIEGELSLIGGSYDEGVSWKSYTGSPIIPQNRFGIKELSTMGYQGMAIYNNIAFFPQNGGGTFNWFSVLTGESGTGCPLGFSGSGYHCNSASFSNVFYDSNDKFPLLYIAGMEGTYIHEMKVVRITPTQEGSFTASLVQTITIPFYANVAMEGNYMYLNGDSGLKKCVVPSIWDENDQLITNYTLVDADILKTWTIYVPQSLQGCAMHNGVFYQLSNEGIMLVFDTITEAEVNRITMRNVGVTAETEDLDFSGDTMFIACAGHFYRVWL